MSFHVRLIKEPAAFCAWYGAEARRLIGDYIYFRDHTQHKVETTIQDGLHSDSICMGRRSFFEYHIMGLPPPRLFLKRHYPRYPESRGSGLNLDDCRTTLPPIAKPNVLVLVEGLCYR